VIVFCDFDGTVSRRDVGNRLLHHFSGGTTNAIVRDWLEGRIDSRECLLRECALARATEEELRQFSLSQEIDPHFPELVSLLRERGIPLVVLSDGLDFYIGLIFEKYGLTNIEFYANRLEFKDGKLLPHFPYFEEGCGYCGNCKKYHFQRLYPENKPRIYIGDGLSDKHVAELADILFAKDDLAKICDKEGIKYQPYTDLGDVVAAIRSII
jgi:2-hydroxy-3-keto-5-methylthiopentenyl-1-phosphate phosphatase